MLVGYGIRTKSVVWAYELGRVFETGFSFSLVLLFPNMQNWLICGWLRGIGFFGALVLGGFFTA